MNENRNMHLSDLIDNAFQYSVTFWIGLVVILFATYKTSFDSKTKTWHPFALMIILGMLTFVGLLITPFVNENSKERFVANILMATGYLPLIIFLFGTEENVKNLTVWHRKGMEAWKIYGLGVFVLRIIAISDFTTNENMTKQLVYLMFSLLSLATTHYFLFRIENKLTNESPKKDIFK